MVPESQRVVILVATTCCTQCGRGFDRLELDDMLSKDNEARCPCGQLIHNATTAELWVEDEAGYLENFRDQWRFRHRRLRIWPSNQQIGFAFAIRLAVCVLATLIGVWVGVAQGYPAPTGMWMGVLALATFACASSSTVAWFLGWKERIESK